MLVQIAHRLSLIAALSLVAGAAAAQTLTSNSSFGFGQAAVAASPFSSGLFVPFTPAFVATNNIGLAQAPTASTVVFGTTGSPLGNPLTVSAPLNTFAPQPNSVNQPILNTFPQQPANAALPVLTTFIPALGGASDRAVVRIANIGNLNGTATLQIYDALSGAALGSLTTGTIPAHGGIQFTSDALLAQLNVSPGQQAATFNLGVSATFRGMVQVLDIADTGVVNASSCGVKTLNDGVNLGLVEGPGESDLLGVVRIANTGATVGGVRLSLRDPATGNTVATWTSPAIAPFAQLSVTTATVATQAIPAIAQSTLLLGIALDASQGAMRVDHVARNTATGALVDMSTSCATGTAAGP